MNKGSIRSYSYDWMNHLVCVDMTRAGTGWTVVPAYTYTSGGVTCVTTYTGGTRQTRTFAYNNAGQLVSATNPESGTVTYTYNGASVLRVTGRKALVIVEMDNEGTWLPCRLVYTDHRSTESQIGPPRAGCTFGAWSRDGSLWSGSMP